MKRVLFALGLATLCYMTSAQESDDIYYVPGDNTKRSAKSKTTRISTKDIRSINYKVKQAPVPIYNCKTGELITYVQTGKTLEAISYKVPTRTYAIKYKDVSGCVEEIWLPNIDDELRNIYLTLHLDSIVKAREAIRLDSLKKDKINKDQLKLGYGPLPEAGDTLFCFMECPLWDKFGTFKQLALLKPGDEAIYVDFNPANSHIVRISYNNITGIASRTKLKNKADYADYLLKEAKRLEEKRIRDEQDKIEAEKERIANERAKQEAAKARIAAAQKRKSELIRKYGQSAAMKILDGNIWLGMTDDMARESWGAPSDINRTVGSWGVHEQWVYRTYDTYLYFEDGILTSWQD